MRTLALTQDVEVQVLVANTAGLHDIDAVVSSPGWYAAGAFRMPATALVRLEIFGNVSNSPLILRAKLYCLRKDDGTTIAEDVSGSYVTVSEQVTARAVSGAFELLGGREYSIEFEITGGASSSLFGSLLTAQLLNA